MTSFQSRDSLTCLDTLTVGDKTYTYYNLKAAEQSLGDLSHLPCCIRILLENLLRHEDGQVITVEDMRSLSAFHALRKRPPAFPFRPARVLMGEETALSVLTDLAAMREAQIRERDDPALLVLAHETDVALSSHPKSLKDPSAERIAFLRWGANAFPGLKIVPPGKGRSCVLNATFLARIVGTAFGANSETPLVFPDTLLGESPRLSLGGALGTLVLPSNPLDLEAVLFGAGLPFALPGLLGIKITGKRPKTATASDIAFALLKAVRQNNGKGKMIEFFGPGLDQLSIADRLVIADILDESGATSVFFPVDGLTIAHLATMGEDPAHAALVEAYAKAQGLWRESAAHDAQKELSFSAHFDFPLDPIRPSLAGPGMAYNPVILTEAGAAFLSSFPPKKAPVSPLAAVKHGDVVWACLGPSGGALHLEELVAAGLAARKAREQGLNVKPWVRAILDLRDPVLDSFLSQTGLAAELEAIGFVRRNEDGPQPALHESVIQAVEKEKIAVCAFGAAPPTNDDPFPKTCGAAYLASPALIVAYAVAGNVTTSDLISVHLSEARDFLKDKPLAPLYRERKATLWEGDSFWQTQPLESGPLFPWQETSLLIRRPSILEPFSLAPPKPQNVSDARFLAAFGADATAESLAPPAGPIPQDSPAARHLIAQGAAAEALGRFEDYSGHEAVMLRGAFAGPGFKNLLANDSGEPFFERAARFQKEKTPLLLAAGQNYGCGEAGQEWAAKATRLLGVRAVIAESFAESCRINLLRVGVLPLQLKTGVTREDLKLDGKETASLAGLTDFLRPPAEVMLTVNHPDSIERYMLSCRLDTEEEMETWRHGSLWAETIRNLILLAG